MSQNVLSRNQKKALAALLEHRTINQAAEACGLARQTLSRYLRDPSFRSALDQAEAELIDEAGRTLIVGQPLALKTLYELMTRAENESTRRLAAKDWLDFELKWRACGTPS